MLLPAVSISNRENTVPFHSYAYEVIGNEFKFSEVTLKKLRDSYKTIIVVCFNLTRFSIKRTKVLIKQR